MQFSCKMIGVLHELTQPFDRTTSAATNIMLLIQRDKYHSTVARQRSALDTFTGYPEQVTPGIQCDKKGGVWRANVHSSVM
jgi:hypothetical protein